MVYTDVPAQVSVLPEGRFMMPEHSSVFLAWARRQIQIPTTCTPLSIRWVGNGQRFFQVQGTRSVVDDNSYLLLNSGQESASEIDSPWSVRCYTVCFRPGMVEDVLRALVTPEDRLLDEPERTDQQPVNFVEKVYPHHDGISTVLARLTACTSHNLSDSNPSYAWFEEQFHELLVQMLAVHRNVRREIESLPGVRATTRLELYRRLHRAREFMDASLEQPLTIAEIAQVAWFSPYHFLRLFKQAFGETPHQYLIRRRLDRAQSLLIHSDMPVTEICYAIGFESLGSFSGLFHRQIGQTPMQFRRETRNRS